MKNKTLLKQEFHLSQKVKFTIRDENVIGHVSGIYPNGIRIYYWCPMFDKPEYTMVYYNFSFFRYELNDLTSDYINDGQTREYAESAAYIDLTSDHDIYLVDHIEPIDEFVRFRVWSDTFFKKVCIEETKTGLKISFTNN